MKEVAEQLRNVVNEYSIHLDNMDDNAFLLKPDPAKWSKKEILGHLIDSAQNNIQRFIRVQYEQEPFVFYNQNEWVRIQDYQNGYSKEEIIELWKLLNKQIVTILQHFPSEKQALKCYKDKELVSISFVIEDYVRHLLHHLEQIVK